MMTLPASPFPRVRLSEARETGSAGLDQGGRSGDEAGKIMRGYL